MRLGPLNIVNSKRLERSSLSLDEYVEYFTYLSHQYPLLGGVSYPTEKLEEIGNGFPGLVRGAYQANGVVFACVLKRLLLFSEARFQFRQLRSGRPGELFGRESLLPLEQPEPGKTTGDLLARMEVDVSFAGNSLIVRRGNRLKRLRPDWVGIVLGGDGESDPDAEVIGYRYWPGGPHSGEEPQNFLREEVAHYAPIPDPLAQYRGMSWLTPVVREVMADSGWRDHKIKFLEQGGVPPVFYKIDPQSMTQDQFDSFVAKYRAAAEGAGNAYKSVFMRAAVDPIPIGANIQQMDFKVVQGAGETRIAAAAGVPPTVVGLSEGLQGSSLNAGNFAEAMRNFADLTMRPLWRNVAGSLSTIIDIPPGSELWYDDRDIPALQEDLKDAADVQERQARAIKSLAEAGFSTDSVVDAITSGDLKRLKHTGLLSVQLQEPGSQNGKPTEIEVPA
jgi:phage portal protein BeeE